MQQNQPGNVLSTGNSQNPQTAPKKKNYSALSIFMAIIFAVVLILLGERAIFDLNRFVNPVIDKEYTNIRNNPFRGNVQYDYESPKTPARSLEMAVDSASAVSNTKVYYRADQKGRYMMYKVVIHAAVIIPIFIAAFILYYLKKKNKQLKAITVSFLVFAFWMIFHLLGETMKFVMDEYKNFAIYGILIILTAVFGFLAYYAEARHSRENVAQ